ncbi:hypothetical protein Q3G72_020627 [Acer saccharum]|nr:hypothetical protein Q3G72_020627 [Acer saccharum]
MFSRNAFLVDIVNTSSGRVLKLDSIEGGKLWKNIDVLIFNTWHWWLHTGRKQPSRPGLDHSMALIQESSWVISSIFNIQL